MPELVFFLLLSSGGVLCAGLWGKKFEETAPITAVSLIIIVFLWGICGKLRAGAIFVLAIGVCAYVFTAAYIIKKKRVREFFKSLVTPGFVVFAALFIVGVFCNFAREVSGWDEYSHWADIVKIMTQTDSLGCAPEAGARFPHYPPAMALLQYIYQAVCRMLLPSAGFSEWRLYVAFRAFMISMLIPFLRGLSLCRPRAALLSIGAVVLLPLFSFSEAYSSLYIDPVLAITAGAGLAELFIPHDNDVWHKLRTLLIAAVLALLKEAGLLFAVFIAAAHIAECAQDYRKRAPIERRRALSRGTALAAAALAPRWIWSLYVRANAGQTVSRQFDLVKLAEALTGGDSGYRRDVLKAYSYELLSARASVGANGVELNYISLLSLLLLTAYLIYHAYKRAGVLSEAEAGRQRMVLITAAGLSAAYLLGLCLAYMFNFAEVEAVHLASMPRYLGVMFNALWALCVLAWVRLLELKPEKGGVWGAVLACALIVATPLTPVLSDISRRSAKESVELRAYYDDMVSSVNEKITGNPPRVYIVSQEDAGLDYWALRYLLRPAEVNEPFSWSIGEKYGENDIWTREMTAEEWGGLLAQEFDYALLYRVDESFERQFVAQFADPNGIEPFTLYKVNSQGRLERCE